MKEKCTLDIREVGMRDGLQDAGELAAHLHHWPDIRWSALVPNVRGAARSLEAGIDHVEYVVSAADGHSLANVRRTTAQAVAAIADVQSGARRRWDGRGHHRHGVGLPLRRPGAA